MFPASSAGPEIKGPPRARGPRDTLSVPFCVKGSPWPCPPGPARVPRFQASSPAHLSHPLPPCTAKEVNLLLGSHPEALSLPLRSHPQPLPSIPFSLLFPPGPGVWCGGGGDFPQVFQGDPGSLPASPAREWGQRPDRSQDTGCLSQVRGGHVGCGVWEVRAMRRGAEGLVGRGAPRLGGQRCAGWGGVQRGGGRGYAGPFLLCLAGDRRVPRLGEAWEGDGWLSVSASPQAHAATCVREASTSVFARVPVFICAFVHPV